MDVKVNVSGPGLDSGRIEEMKPAALRALDRLWSGEEPVTGWVQAPVRMEKEELDGMLNAADVIKSESGLLVVIGAGDSCLGAGAALQALPRFEAGVRVMFLGDSLSSPDYAEALEAIRAADTVVCAVSQSGGEPEMLVGFDIIRSAMEEKYGGKDYGKRMMVLTGGGGGRLRELAEQEGCMSFALPDDAPGAYSAFTAATLIPAAAAGIDIREILHGAKDMALAPDWDAWGTEYAIARYLMHRDGRAVEALEFSHGRLGGLGRWMSRLYGGSGKGLQPWVLMFPGDLPLRERNIRQEDSVFLETMVETGICGADVPVDREKFLGGKLEDLNRAVMDGVRSAGGDLPAVRISMPRLTPYCFGQLLYYLETTAAVTAMMTGGDPFDRSGAEACSERIGRICLRNGREK